MKVLVLTHNYGGNGAARCVLDLMAHATAHWQWQITAMSPNDPAQLRAIRKAGATPITDVQHLNYDLAIINSVVSIEGFAQALERLPTLLWIHEGATPLQSFPLPRWQAWLAQAKAIVFQSDWQRDEVWADALKIVPAKRVHIVPNALSPITASVIAQVKVGAADSPRVSLSSLRFGAPASPPTPSAPAPALQRAGLTKGIAWCGTVIGRKRPQDFLQAIERVQQALSLTAPLGHVFGSLAHHQSVPHPDFSGTPAELASRYTASRFHGEMPHGDVLRQIGLLGAFVSTSQEETQGMALLEAAALGLPLVVSNLPPYRGVWAHGRNCLSFEPGDVDALTAHLLRLFREPELAKSLAAAAAQTLAQFEWPEFTGKMKLAVESVLAR